MKLDRLIEEVERKRIAKSMTVNDLARIGGCSSLAISKWIKKHGECQQTAGILALNKICYFFKIDVDKFLPTDTFNERLTLLAFKNKTDFATLSSSAGNASTSISDWMLGNRKPKYESIIKLAGYCNVTPEWILHGYNEPKKYGLIDLPVATAENQKNLIFMANPKSKAGNFINLDNGMIASIESGKTYSQQEFNDLFEVVA